MRTKWTQLIMILQGYKVITYWAHKRRIDHVHPQWINIAADQDDDMVKIIFRPRGNQEASINAFIVMLPFSSCWSIMCKEAQSIPITHSHQKLWHQTTTQHVREGYHPTYEADTKQHIKGVSNAHQLKIHYGSISSEIRWSNSKVKAWRLHVRRNIASTRLVWACTHKNGSLQDKFH